jgi:hypothetical protein
VIVDFASPIFLDSEVKFFQFFADNSRKFHPPNSHQRIFFFQKVANKKNKEVNYPCVQYATEYPERS